MENKCLCGCGTVIAANRKYVSGHNFVGQVKTEEHCRRIAEGQRKAWKTKRTRMPVGHTWIDAGGYVRVKMAEGKGRWVLEHVIVASKMLGRPLVKGEIVHHINGNRRDNRPNNLYVCRDAKHHNEVHRTEAVAMRLLLEAGLVVFKDGAYEAVLPR